jgi:nitrate reductase NapAB chaperone NapD
MPIFSYLAIPQNGAKESLRAELAVLDYCHVIPADNHDVLVVVTDTPDETTEKSLQESLKSLPSLQSLSLAFGYDEQILKK